MGIIRNPLGETKTKRRAAPPSAEETVYDNHLWAHAWPRLSICVPVYRLDVSPLVSALSWCEGSAMAELVLYEDGSGAPGLPEALAKAADGASMPVRVVSCAQNKGRAGARNAAIAHARADWILLLDADMWPDEATFISAYVTASEAAGRPALVVGGYSLKQAPHDKRFRLHRWQAAESECLPSSVRRRAPGRYVFTSNVLAHRRVLETCPFDETFTGWGWEDTDWGLRAEKHFPVLHMDNTATHLGLDDAKTLMGKYRKSGANFARLVQRHPEALDQTALMRGARMAKRLPLRRLFRAMAGLLARDPFGLLPIGLRGRALKTWRALVYAEHV